jgi:hypothetical protein
MVRQSRNSSRVAPVALSIELPLRKSCAGLNGTNAPFSCPISTHRPPRDVIGHQRDVVHIHRDILGISAIQPRIAQKHLLGAQRLPSTATVPAMSTDMFALCGGDTIANGEVIDGGACGGHGSGDLVSRHAWQPDAAAQYAGAYRHIVRTDTTERDPDDHLARPGQGFGDRLAVQG